MYIYIYYNSLLVCLSKVGRIKWRATVAIFMLSLYTLLHIYTSLWHMCTHIQCTSSTTTSPRLCTLPSSMSEFTSPLAFSMVAIYSTLFLRLCLQAQNTRHRQHMTVCDKPGRQFPFTGCKLFNSKTQNSGE